MPTVSIIVPNYNHAAFLKQRLNSLINQTFTDFELIYLDDASTDESNRIFEPFSHDPRVRSIVNQQNTGSPFQQWDRGVRAARADLVWIAESDDYAELSFLERMVPLLEANKRTGIAYCASHIVNSNGITEPLGYPFVHDASRWTADFRNDGRAELAQYLAVSNTIPNASAVLFRKSVYEAAGYAQCDFRLTGDYLMWAKMLLVADIVYLAHPLNFFRRHTDNVRTKSERDGIAVQESYEVLAWIAENADVPPEGLRRALLWRACQWLNFLARTGGSTLTRNRAIWRAARVVDPHPLSMLAAAAVAGLRKRSGARPALTPTVRP